MTHSFKCPMLMQASKKPKTGGDPLIYILRMNEKNQLLNRL